MEKDARIFVCGHNGLVGSAILRRLKKDGYTNILIKTHKELDLERQAEVEVFFKNEKPDYVFIAAAKVGGILANSTYPADFIYRNLSIQLNIINSSYKFKVKRLLFLGSSCIYPRECQQPMKEEYLLTGPLEPTNQPYAIAKIAGIIQCDAYNRQYGTQYLAVMPANLYGINDNFDFYNSHVLPVLIRKFHLAKLAYKGDWNGIEKDEEIFGKIPIEVRDSFGLSNQNKSKQYVLLWGTGNPYREFLYVDDLVDACMHLMKLSDDNFFYFSNNSIDKNGKKNMDLPLINIGYGREITILELTELVSEIVGFKGEIIWDNAKPDGMPRKLLDISRITKLGWKPSISLKEGIKLAYDWYLKKVNFFL